QAARAGAKAAGVVIDDAAVTPRYVVGFTADRELPIIRKIALGSVRNKLLYLLPAALLLSALAPWAITPLLMLGGAFLCYEGTEKVYEALGHRRDHGHEPAVAASSALPAHPRSLEDEKVSSAIRTDLILSAEIMALTLSAVPGGSLWMQAAVLAAVGLGITALVYGGVALIVKADDLGLALASAERPISGLFGRSLRDAPASRWDRLVRPLTRAVGRALVRGMPVFLRALGVVGTAAMLWVGGGIILHGLSAYGLAALEHAVHEAAAAAGRALPAVAPAAEWTVGALASSAIGLLVGAVLIPLAERIASPIVRWSKRRASSQPPPAI
ncbi:MAG TPA: DUF808 domain-containing protein, partial [Acetobacteraceae bacterium]|nr:DUF808 domain-containing protein [Acetobacteraceae bacterium]